MPAISAGNAITVQNLLAAFETASNAHARYTAFAARAEDEGLHGTAGLFRTAARAEQIHSTNHARVIGLAGGHPECEIYPVAVRTTLENLKTALNGEQNEIGSVLPGFMEEAAERKNTAALRSFTGALEAGKTRARLFSESIALVQAGMMDAVIGTWIGEVRDFYVCPVCGYSSETEEEHEHCPVCKCLWEKFEIIR
jgi:rubrerythrin